MDMTFHVPIEKNLESGVKAVASRISLIEFNVAAEDVAMVEELLVGQGLSPAIVQTVRSSAPGRFRLYCDPRNDDPVRLRQFLLRQFEAWEDLLSDKVSGFGIRTIKREDWSESWKRHFKPLWIGRRLVIKPSWETVPVGAGQAVVELDPGMSFGTGHHGTTLACLQLLEEITRSPVTGLSFLDAGCGSGILALAAAALGCRPVTAFDCDAESVRIAAENINKSSFRAHIKLHQAELSSFPVEVRYRIAAANILAPVVRENAVRLTSLLDRSEGGAWLILAGILDRQYRVVRDDFTALGLREHSSRLLDGWRTGCFHLRG